MNRPRKMFHASAWVHAILVVLLVAMAGCATNPATGERQISLVSSGQEVEMGRQADPAIIAEYGLYQDRDLAAYVDSIGQALAKVSHLPSLRWHFRLLDSPVVNAFALPGGYIYVTRGIVAHMNSEAQLAGVIGHEIGHVTARHSAQQMTSQQLAQIGLLAGMVVFEGFRPYGGLAAQGLGLLFLKYSRDHERQADELGIQYAVKSRYDPRQIPPTYDTLKRLGERAGAGGLPNFLSTHPDPGDREVRTRELAEASISGTGSNLVVRGPGYQNRIDGVVYGDDPRQGYFENSRFYHPELKFQMIYPSGWVTANTPSAVFAQSEQLQAVMRMTLGTSTSRTLTPSEYVDSLRARGAILQASGRSEQFRDFPAWTGNIVVQSEGGNTTLVAGFVRIAPGQFLEIVGQSKGGAANDQILSSVRSVAALTDQDKLTVTPDRVVVKRAPRTAAFSSLWSEMGTQAIGVEEGAILNSTRASTTIQAGTPLKTVAKGERG
jgi:predicted Zn-dependent protease